ncbi:TIM-barrel domain-containing protein [Vibrio mangrovi]|uniref:Alpha-xylosidase n=1 Tax=Vibrio mangrovi TaxID=474394 RepID=A0A1Y6ITT0_9VIBR|nr:TIM-barrel domain-containing protein [Vibrio mangrovi]MDW6003743.1 glycoside hydrolase family 31 protein [Vibrio mangrovi]SMR99463.1 Alpha-xylosidase [Vibrio mangrovi]
MITINRMRNTLVGLSAGLFTLTGLLSSASAEVFRTKFESGSDYLVVEILDNDLVHFELSAVGNSPSTDSPIYTSPMVLKTDYPGATNVVQNDNIIETSDMRLEINKTNLCITLIDKTKSNAQLTTVCPVNLSQPLKGLNIDPGQMQNVYGLGQKFKQLGSADGDWTTLGVREGKDNWGNGFEVFQNAMVGNVQIPVYYALGSDQRNYALFMDNVYWQKWDFTQNWWEARMYGDQLRFYLMTGPDLPDLRSDFMELTGRPPVPPRNAFGLWVSEFGYDNWGQIDLLKNEMRDHHFPLDGFVLDLTWFGGISPETNMGRLNWDQNQDSLVQNNPYYFPNPGDKIKQYAQDHIHLAAIEESYLAETVPPLDTQTEIPHDLMSYLRDGNNQCDPSVQNPAETNGFWGNGWMFDWSDPELDQWIHNHRRYPNLVQLGINTHWTDLGEPETFNQSACYEGVETTSSGIKNKHADMHNLHNLLWNKSIWDGYVDKQGQTDNLGVTNPRPLILTRSGAAGTQRFGAAMWSGDIASNLQSLASHANAQMHMSFSGIDYYGADIGGFRREVMPGNSSNGPFNTSYQDEMYTQWFANGSWFDIPIRPHTDNEFGTGRDSCQDNFGHRTPPCYETAPDRIGKTASNLANIRQRYELIPYYYSLAYRAYLYGEPMVPPPVFYDQNDVNLREMGNEKMIGKDILVGVVASHGEYQRDIYLPQGKWINYHSNEWVNSSGEKLNNVPVYRNGLFRLPAFVRAGAILPQMFVDQNTLDAWGHERAGTSTHNELILRVYASETPSDFTLYEDDGLTLDYTPAGRPLYQYRTTKLRQQQSNRTVQVTIEPTVNWKGTNNVSESYPNAINNRTNVIKLIVNQSAATKVTLNGTVLTQYSTQQALDSANSGWYNAGHQLIVAKSGALDVNTSKTFVFELEATQPVTSVNFVCDNGVTTLGQSIYVTGNTEQLGNWDPARAVKLSPNIYYDYIQRTDLTLPGPTNPVWTGVIRDLPPGTDIEWKCIKRDETDPAQVQWQPGNNNQKTTAASGYAGNSYGSF